MEASERLVGSSVFKTDEGPQGPWRVRFPSASAGFNGRRDVGSLLVHVTHGPEAPTRAALACLVALAAVDEGHEVTMFFAGDAVHLMKDSVIESTTGIGTGALADHIPNLVAKEVPIHVSKMSANAREVTEADLASKNATFAAPKTLVQLAFGADRILTY